MEKLILALVSLADAGVKYLEAKKLESEGLLALAQKRAEKEQNPMVSVGAAAQSEKKEPVKTEPEKLEPEAAPKRTRRTKEQIAADEAEEKAKKEEAERLEKLAGQNHVPPAPPAADVAANPFSEGTAQAPAAENPFGNSEAPAAQAPAAAAPAADAAQMPPPATPAPKTLTEQESYDKMVKVMAAFVGLGKNDTPNGLEQNRAYLKEKFKIAKIGDLTHEMRLVVISDTEARIAAYKKPSAVK